MVPVRSECLASLALAPPQVRHTGSMELRAYSRELRGAMYRRDGAAVLEALHSTPWPQETLQLIGDALLVALNVEHATTEAQGAAREATALLRSRGWEGDIELADQLNAGLGEGAIPLLRKVPVDLEELAALLEGDPVRGGGRLDLRTGELWRDDMADDDLADCDDEAAEPDADSEAGRWLWFACRGSRAGYRDMEDFIADLPDPRLAQLLRKAIIGPGAFRRFTSVLSRHPDSAERWYAVKEDRLRGRARTWLADAGYAPGRR